MRFFNRVAVAAVVLIVAFLLSSLGVAVFAQPATDTGFPGIEGPTFTFGVILAESFPNPMSVLEWQPSMENSPYAITGYVMSKAPGGIHIWVSSASSTAMAIGVSPGHIVVVLCGESQVKNLNSGDWVQIAGFVEAGQLTYAYQAVLPAPFSY